MNSLSIFIMKVVRVLLIVLLSAQSALVLSEQNSTPTINPGDVLYIAYPGEDEFNKQFEIDVQGKINLPEFGPFKVAGLTVAQADAKIKELMALLFRDTDRMSVDLRERNLLLHVLGYVKQPGTIKLPVSGNVQTAIQLAGGLLPGAQLDRMQVQRNEETLSFSYKAYLDSGDTSTLPALRSLDTLFVPASPLTGNVQIDFDAATLSSSGDAADEENSYRIFGEVKSPGRFSFKSNHSVIDAIMRAGGVTRYAGVEQIKIITNNTPTAFNLKQYLESGDSSMMPILQPGTTIFVPIQEEEIKTGKNVVYIMGEVFKPGAFESKEGATLLDILANAGGPTRFAESRQIRILAAEGNVVPFDLQAYTEGNLVEGLPAISPGDAIFVPEKTDINENSWLKVPPNRSIRIIGQVYNPGRFEWSEEMNLLDLLSHAEGPTARADIANIRVLSNGVNGKVNTSIFNLDKFVRYGGNVSEIPVLKAGYTIIVPELPQDPTDNKAQWVRQSKDDSIYIMGQVGSPGRFMFNDEMSFLDILAAADGPNANADLHHIRVVHRNLGGAKMTEFNLALYFETGDETLLPVVKPGDSIFIPEKDRNWLDQPNDEMVRVIGAVNKPGRYNFNDQMNLLDLIAQAGGTTSTAYLDKLVIVNASCCENRAVSFDLLGFLKAPDINKLPIIRPGDTLFIADKSESNWRQFMSGITDIFKIISIVGIVGAL